MKIEVTANATVFENYDGVVIEDRVVDSAAEKVLESMKESITARVTKLIETKATDMLHDAIAETLNNPIALTNSYGERTGKTTTLRGMIADKMTEMMQPKSDYGSRDRGTVDKLIAECVQQFIAKEMVNDLNGVKTKLKTALNNAVLGNLQKQVTDVIKGY